ncbi:aromatic acid exporter family protein [Corynebacterium sp. 320]|uniref:FUSC family protein n=1 Tax=Corynebacterium TaxID=1716 RepID=UPI00125CB36F|nr:MULTISPECIES: FUSC family protein [Corynebacterium]KAB1503111.1 aromatic acid exporter family protein [Corynebacterium sp. 320]KAB1550677.1 aromatic acid exporter family protein [Corynebacterium sp. 321]KAB1551037.1 aromatic acid exporter family protein [Corynebacterium sp. 319]KAB3526908.1 aromatic acid exporter family protein [Corynebacterium sp. 250]KAB3538401.1 aromatic acid exporter family protein [Corynebacterium sp. 366]
MSTHKHSSWDESRRNDPVDPSSRAARLRRFIRSSAPGVRSAAQTLTRQWPKRGAMRVREKFIFALQAAIAAALALLIAENVFGHENAFFAPMAAVISLGVSAGRRTRRTFELTLGVAVGIGIGDVVIGLIGGGYWQVSLVVFLGIIIASFVDKGVIVATQSANTGVLIATLIPPGSEDTWGRMIDALVGGLLGILVMALIPNSPLRPARHVMSELLAKAALVLDDVATGMKRMDYGLIEEALQQARGTQAAVNNMLNQAGGGAEMVAVSPLYWNAKRHTRTMNRTLGPVDNTMRNTRVLARRAVVMVSDGVEPTPAMHSILSELANEIGHLSAVFSEGGTRGTRRESVEIPEIVRNLQRLAGQCTLDVAEGTGLSGTVVLAQIRSIIVDTLEVCGYSHESAMAALAPTVESPSVPPEVWD